MQFISIKDVLTFWRERQADKSVAWLAHRVGVSPSTIHRIFDGETTNPDFATGRAICLNALEKEAAFTTLESIYPERKKIIIEDRKSFVEVEKNSDEISDIFSDYYKWFVFVLAASTGVKKSYLAELGLTFVRKAEVMVHENQLVFSNGSYSLNKKINFIVNPNGYLQAINHILRTIDERRNRGTVDQGGLVHFSVAGLNQEAKDSIYSILQSTIRQVNEIVESPKYTGDLSISLALLMSEIN